MNVPQRLAATAAALAMLVAGGWAVGGAVGPVRAVAAAPAGEAAEAMDGDGAHAGDGAPDAAAETAALPGLATADRGYTLVPANTVHAGGPFAFTITGSDGTPVTAFDVEHEKRMHLIVVRRDTSGYRHVHPEMAPDGTWTVPLDLPAGGSYRAFADFTPTGGPALTLGVDVAVPGDFAPVTHEVSRTAQVDGYTVTLDGDLAAGTASDLTLAVSRDGAPVTDLDPYLGAAGHLVALREGDLAYLHVHSEEAGLRFGVEVPGTGRYRLFLDFSHGGLVRTAEFTLEAR
jgi:hypothetical protein